MDATATVIGREQELAEIQAFLGEPIGMRVLVLEGEAGIGKTTVFDAGVRLAEQESTHVLASRPAPTETQLSFAAAADLIAAELPAVRAELPPPQIRALEIALRLQESGDGRLDPHTVAAGFLGALRVLSTRGPLVIAVDDVQWLDQSSASLIEFASRRLRDEEIAFLLARRGRDDDPLPLGLAQGVSEHRLRRLALRPFSVGALHHLLQLRLGTSYPRPTIRRLHTSSGGNPFYALELARAIERRGGTLAADEPLPVPPTLAEVVAERIASLAPPVLDLLGYLAALSDPQLAVAERVIDRTSLDGVLDEAVAAGIVTVAEGAIRFQHPLLAFAVYSRLGPERRRRVHRTLAEIVPGAEERALHLAVSTGGPDASVASQLERAADEALNRGAVDAAARLLEHAARVTPQNDADNAARRVISAADKFTIAGDSRYARSMLSELTERLDPGPMRADAQSLLSWTLPEDDLGVAAELCRRALLEARGRPAIEAITHYRLGVITSIRGDMAGATDHGCAAVEGAELAGDKRLLALALAELGHAKTLLGGGITQESRRAVAVERSLGADGPVGATALLGRVHMHVDELDGGRELLRGALDDANARGREAASTTILTDLVDLECRAGRLEDAAAYAQEACELTWQAGNDQEYAASRHFRALVAVLRGELEQAQEDSLAGLETAERIGDVMFQMKHRGVLGLNELSRDEPAEAHRWLGPPTDQLFASGIREFSIYQLVENEIEAVLSLGELDRGKLVVETLERAAHETGRSWTRAVAARGRGLLLAAQGEIEAARGSLDAALDEHKRVPQPFQHARTLLIRGSLERRDKRKRVSREFLERALAIFQGLPAPCWVDKTHRELRRLSLRSTSSALTETESRVAALAAEGLTNREVAAAAFVSQKTVEANLSKIYRKLGVRSRVELARTLARSAPDSRPPET